MANSDPYTLETQLALMQRELAEIHRALYGNGDGKGGLIHRVEMLADAAERGRWALRTTLWLGGSIVALLTALGQLRTAMTALWGGHN
jgi:hypothetical protein